MPEKIEWKKSLHTIIDVESYESMNRHEEETIDIVLKNNKLFRISPFVCNIGDCLFDSLQHLLHMRFTFVELRNGTIDYFLNCLAENDLDALFLYRYELDPQTLNELHGITDVNAYLQCMRLSAVIKPNCKEYGL